MRLIHWNVAEGRERAARLASAGYATDYSVPNGMSFLRELEKYPPAAMVIDLHRLPSQGRDVALAIRHSRRLRHIPLVFVDGLPEKVVRLRKNLPDCVFTNWSRIGSALRKAIQHPPSEPLVPASVLSGYSGTPLPKKLGIKPGSVVALLGAPRNFRRTLGPLPQGARLRWGLATRYNLTIWFVRDRKEFERRVGALAKRTDHAPMWIAWPKKASGVVTELSESVVRRAGLAVGMVDYKICAIDATWSGLLFSRRKREGSRA